MAQFEALFYSFCTSLTLYDQGGIRAGVTTINFPLKHVDATTQNYFAYVLICIFLADRQTIEICLTA